MKGKFVTWISVDLMPELVERCLKQVSGVDLDGGGGFGKF